MNELPSPLNVMRSTTSARNQIRATRYRFTSQHDVDLDLFVAQNDQAPPQTIRLIVLGGNEWPAFVAGPGRAFDKTASNAEAFAALATELAKQPHTAVVWFAPRGVGPTAWGGNLAKQTHIRRRFALLGQTLDGMRVWDVRRAVQAIRSIDGFQHTPISMTAKGREAGIALYASLFEPNIARLDLTSLPPSHRIGPDLLNVLQTLDTPETVAMAAERCEVRLHKSDRAEWSYPEKVAHHLNWGDRRLQTEQ